MKTIPTRTKWLLSLSPILAIVLLICCHRAAAGAREAEPQDAANEGLPEPVSLSVRPPLLPDTQDDLHYLEARREYLSQLNGTAPGSVSPEDFARARVAARALPPSPLLENRKFTSFPPTDVPAPLPDMTPTPSWLFPNLYPIYSNFLDYGGKAGAMVYAIAADPTNANTVYTGSYGGLARSRDGGVSWSYLSDGWLSQEISAIALDPTKPSTVYVGTGRDNMYHSVGLYISSDGGDAWTGPFGVTEFQGKIIRQVAFDPNDSKNVYVANGCSPYSFPCTGPTPGLWHTDNAGQSWTQRAPNGTTTNGVYSLAVDPATSALYAAIDAGLYKSTSGGVSWTLIPNRPAGTLSLVNSVLYVLVGNPDGSSTLSKTTNDGATWTTIPTNCPSGAGCAAGNNMGFSVFAVDPHDANVIVGGGFNYFRSTRLYLTENATTGATWSEINPATVHVDQRVIAFAPDYTRTRIVYVGNDGGVSRSVNHGQTWINLNQNLPGALLQGIAISQNDSMIAGTQDNGAIFSNQGTAWNMFTGGDAAHTLINPTDSTDAYFDLAGYRYWGRYRYGVSPDPISITPPQFVLPNGDAYCHPLPPFSMNQNPPNYLLTACQQVVRSSNSGANWTSIGPAIGTGPAGGVVTTLCQAPSNPQVIYAAANNWGEQIFVTTNANSGGSALWTNVTHPGQTGGLPTGTKIFAIAVDSNDPQTAYLACISGIFKTTNTGGAWNPLGVTADAGYTDVLIDYANPTHVFAASRLGVIASTNGGTSWGDMSAGIPGGTDIRGLTYNSTSQQLVLQTYGRGAYVMDLDTTLPTVSITSPAPGSVSGIVVVTANASDNHRVVGVQFKRDGLINIGLEDTLPPYSVDWNTTGLSGPHTLTAVARDPAGNTKISLAVNVYVIGGD